MDVFGHNHKAIRDCSESRVNYGQSSYAALLRFFFLTLMFIPVALALLTRAIRRKSISKQYVLDC